MDVFLCCSFSEHNHHKFEGWHAELDKIGQRISQGGSTADYKVSRFSPGDGKLRWYGEVTDVSYVLCFHVNCD